MSKPIRMCINCRKRFLQSVLLRLQCKGKKIRLHSEGGRSFYICKECLNDKKIGKNLAKLCKIDPKLALKMLKEIIDNG